MMRNQMSKILAAPDKQIKNTSGSNGVLSRLFRQILSDLRINALQFGSMLQDYIADPRNGVPNNRNAQTSQRGNLMKELARGQMTWKVLCKGFRLVRFKKVEVFIVATHWNGKVTTHSTVADLGNVTFVQNEQGEEEMHDSSEPEEILDTTGLLAQFFEDGVPKDDNK